MSNDLELHEQIKREHAQQRAEHLARAKAEGLARGKEPFDMAKLAPLVDWRSFGDTVEEAAPELEKLYFTYYSEELTLEDFAVRVAQIAGR